MSQPLEPYTFLYSDQFFTEEDLHAFACRARNVQQACRYLKNHLSQQDFGGWDDVRVDSEVESNGVFIDLYGVPDNPIYSHLP